MSRLSNSKTILIVEDSDDDYEFTQRALKESNLLNPIKRCEDGQDALDYLLHKGKYDAINSEKPGIILLDLNMPGIGGVEVLQEIKINADLKDIPTIVLTTSADPYDIDRCYKDGANTYIQKPVDIDKFFEAIKRLKEYWFEIAILPKESE